MCNSQGFFFRDFSFDKLLGHSLKLFVILSLLVVDDSTEFHIVLVCSGQLFFEVGNADLESSRLFGRFLRSVSMLFDIQVGGLTVAVPDLRIGGGVFGELFL